MCEDARTRAKRRRRERREKKKKKNPGGDKERRQEIKGITALRSIALGGVL